MHTTARNLPRVIRLSPVRVQYPGEKEYCTFVTAISSCSRYTFSMTPRLAVAAAAFAVVTAAPLLAQSTNRIAGVVRDETGGPIRGAIVRAETGGTTTTSPTALTAATDDRGRFIFVVARSGDWKITFEAPGFDPMTIAVSVRLTGAAPNLDVKLDRHEAPEA